jgi:hypothetical protein
MPEERNNGITVKIFLAIFLIFICAIFVVYTYNFLNVNKEYINKESKLSNDCLTIAFEILTINYSGNDLFITVKNNPSSSSSITRMSIMLQNETKSRDVQINPSKQQDISFENFISAQENILVYPNSCEAYAKAILIKK